MTYVVLVTGLSGSGKTALARYLSARGERAISLDAHPGLCRWHDAHSRPATRPEQPDTKYRRGHTVAWRADFLDRLIAAERQAGHDRVFLCGTVGNQRQHLDRFDLVVMLDVGAEPMHGRLDPASRGSDVGRASPQMPTGRCQPDRAATRAMVHNIIGTAAPVEVVGNMVCALAALHQLELSHA